MFDTRTTRPMAPAPAISALRSMACVRIAVLHETRKSARVIQPARPDVEKTIGRAPRSLRELAVQNLPDLVRLEVLDRHDPLALALQDRQQGAAGPLANGDVVPAGALDAAVVLDQLRRAELVAGHLDRPVLGVVVEFAQRDSTRGLAAGLARLGAVGRQPGQRGAVGLAPRQQRGEG